MMRRAALVCAVAAVVSGAHGTAQTPARAPDYPTAPAPLTSVTFSDAFWAPRARNGPHRHARRGLQAERADRAHQELRDRRRRHGRGVLLPLRLRRLRRLQDHRRGVVHALEVRPDSALDRYVDALIAKIAKAQEPDGYLYTARTINPAKPMAMAGKERWSNLKDSHELYNLGHLYEAAAAHNRATGRKTLLAVATKSADLIARTFGPAGLRYPPGHQEIEIGLVKLYRVTGDPRVPRTGEILPRRAREPGRPQAVR